MSIVESPAAVAPPADATWTQVGPTLWVASTRNAFVGTVEQLGDSFVACDGYALEIGTFPDLDTAKLQVLHPASRGYDRRRRQVEARGEFQVLWAVAAGAGLLLAAAFVLVAQGML